MKSLLVIDDEKYFCIAGDNMPGNSGQTSKKHAQKVLVL